MATQPLLTEQDQNIQDDRDEEKQETHQLKYGQSSVNSTGQMQAIFTHSDDDKDNDDGNQFDDEDENTISAKSSVIISQIISRHYGLLFTCTAFGASIGFIIYLFSSYNIWTYILAIIALIIGIVIDHKEFGGQKHVEISYHYKPTQEEIELADQKWSSHYDNDFYLQSNFYSRFRNRYRGTSCVYHKKDSGAMVFEKKAFKRVEMYNGFEIGGGISSFFGFILSLVSTLVSDIETHWFLALLFILFLVVICGLIGCIMERELRKWNFIPPINQVFVRRDSIALHDISHVCCVTYGYHLTHAGVTSASWVETVAILWFKLVAGIFYVVYLILKFLSYIFWVNSAFTLWIFVTASLILLFAVQITKDDDMLNSAMWVVIVTCCLSVLCALFVSPCYRKQIKIGSLTIEQLQHRRLDQQQQKTLFYVFLVCVLFLMVAAVFVSYVASDITNTAHMFFHTDNYSSDVWNKMVCKSERNTAFPFGMHMDDGNQLFDIADVDNVDADERSKLCSSTNYEFLAVSLLLLCILWYLLLAVSFWWNHCDKYQFSMEGKKTPRKWTQYSYMFVYRKSETRTLGIFKKTYVIELTDKDAKKLQNYLNDQCPWYSKPKFCAIHPHSLEFVQAFETIKPVQAQ